jgi:hypothetical protein
VFWTNFSQNTQYCSLDVFYYVVPLYYVQGNSLLVEITAGGDFVGLCDQKHSHKHVSDFGRLRSYDHLELTTEACWKASGLGL